MITGHYDDASGSICESSASSPRARRPYQAATAKVLCYSIAGNILGFCFRAVEHIGVISRHPPPPDVTPGPAPPSTLKTVKRTFSKIERIIGLLQSSSSRLIIIPRCSKLNRKQLYSRNGGAVVRTCNIVYAISLLVSGEKLGKCAPPGGQSTSVQQR